MIEVLSVVSFLLILTALLLPNVLRSKEHARQVFCMNNMRQIAIGCQGYMHDNKNQMPYVTRWLDDFTPVYPYVRSFKVFKCPSTKTPYPTKLSDLSGVYAQKTSKKDESTLASVGDYFYCSTITDIEKNNNYNNGMGNNPYHLDPSNPQVKAIFTNGDTGTTTLSGKMFNGTKYSMVVFERYWTNHLYKCFNTVFISDLHYRLENDGMINYWYLDNRGWIDMSMDPFPEWGHK